jgi:two-component system, OmpR family, sensor kinase
MNSPASVNKDALVLLCVPDGAIESIIVNPEHLDSAAKTGAPLHGLFEPHSAPGIDRLLAEALDDGCTGDRTLALRGGFAQWHSIGAATNDGHVAIVAATSRAGLIDLCQSPPRALLGDAPLVDRLKRAGDAMVRSRSDKQQIEELGALHTEMAAIQRELSKRNAELAYREVEKNRLIGFVAHDLRNPMGVIVGYADLLLQDAALSPEKRRQYLESIAQSGQIVLRMINDLLELTTFESGKLQLEPGACDLADLVYDQVELNRIRAQQKDIDLRIEVSGGLPRLQLDRTRIGQVLDNLLSNAIKFSHRGSVVTVRVGRRSTTVFLTVEDHGCGIPANEIGNLFQPFGRTSVRPTAEELSTGLGLAIAQRIVAAHHGSIEVESTFGVGTTFRVVLPIDVTRIL